MAVPTLVQAFTAATQNNVSASAVLTVGASPATQPQAGDLVVVAPWGYQASNYDVTSVTDSIGTTFSNVIKGTPDAGARPLAYWGVLGSTPTADSYQVTVDHAGASGNYGKSGVMIFRASGGAGWQLDGTAVGAQGAGSGSGTVTLSGLTTTAADAVIVGAIALSSGQANAAIVTPSGYTSVATEQDGQNSMPGNASYKIVSAAGAQSVTWTYSGTYNSSRILLAFSNPDAGGGGGSGAYFVNILMREAIERAKRAGRKWLPSAGGVLVPA